MKNIEKIKNNYLQLFSRECYNKAVEELNSNEMLVCSSLAEFWAYVYSVVPEEHGHYTIFDFVGCIVNKETNEKDVTIPPRIALQAKNEICKYCWGMEWRDIEKHKKTLDDASIMKLLRERSIMERRIKNGNNIIIFGTSSRPIGRTMVASIITKEAIRLRVTKNNRQHTYDWIDFNTLIDAADKDSVDLADYRSCDWLVVDNIINKYTTVKQDSFFINMIDPFFIGRFNDRLPTVLVFKFDIRNPASKIESKFGVGINRIIESKRSYKIPLTE